MKSTVASRGWVMLFLGTLLLRCGGSSVPNPGSEIGLHIIGDPGDRISRLAPRAQAGGITFTRAEIVLSRIKVKSQSQCAGGSSSSNVEFEGPFVVDLLTNVSRPNVAEIGIEPGTYCRLELRMDRMEEDELPAAVDPSEDIVGRSLIVEGQRGDGVPFVAYLEADSEFKIQSPNGFAIGTNPEEDLLVVFRLADWFAGIDLDAADVESGVVTLSEGKNQTLLEDLIHNVKKSAELFRDNDADGRLDDDGNDEHLGDGDDV